MRAITRKKSTGNVFSDLGFGREETGNFRIRATLMAEVEKHIRRRGLSPAEAAREMGVTQPRISDLMRGKIDVFSVDTLITMLTTLGLKVTVTVNRAKAA
ncbi:MAG: XRE family transcriptional regulator [Deltaproteobacteria bacterium]|nr:XRE family transcriptional regulator [Deltaproteobacteria bacterium]